MPTAPEIPDAAAEAAIPMLDRYTESDAIDLAHDVIAAALPHLLPSLYATRHNGDLTVWRENPDHPTRPTALTLTEALVALAALLPDRTDTED